MAVRRIRIKRTFGKKRKRNNICAICRFPYYRRNITGQWVERNPGHREGYKFEEVKTCLGCQSKETSQRMIVLAHVGTPGEVSKRSAAK